MRAREEERGEGAQFNFYSVPRSTGKWTRIERVRKVSYLDLGKRCKCVGYEYAPGGKTGRRMKRAHCWQNMV